VSQFKVLNSITLQKSLWSPRW